MGLKEYRKKRNFKKTSEPLGGVPSKKEPIFVIQKHWATRLHYDFRLEAFGTLKSWAVPKGPPLKVGEKRLAVEVEDHPIAYAKFHGRIPEGQYGAGVVKIWDKGTWIPPKQLKEKLEKGHLEFYLKGKKLKGKWHLQRTHLAGKQPQWLLIKGHNDKKPQLKKKDPWPKILAPQLALLCAQVPEGESWLYETKYDGYRTIAAVKDGKAQMLSRSGLDWTDKYQFIADQLSRLPIKNAVIDGEIVALDENGQSSFSALQIALKESDMSALKYYIFDLLYLNDHDIRQMPLENRKALLRDLLRTKKVKNIFFSEHSFSSAGAGEKLLKSACHEGLEGIIAKDRSAPYVAARSGSWQKIKCSKRQEFVIGGYTDPEGARFGFGALLMGTYEGGRLRYVGKVGTGYTEKTLGDLKSRFKKLTSDVSPFKFDKIPRQSRVHWLRPELVAEIEFKAWTHDRQLRHASFQGLREDKIPQDVHIEIPQEKTPEVHISHPERLVYEKQKVSKLDVAKYYKSVAPWLLRHLSGRPLSMVRCPDKATGQCFFQKHVHHGMTGVHESMIRDQRIIYINSEEGLLQLAQWNVLEFHAWQCHVSNKDNPDQIVFDLDPDKSVEWKVVVHTALHLKELLERLSLKGFLKTTGGKGLHIQVPIAPIYSWEAVKAFAKAVTEQMVKVDPHLYTANMLKKKRTGKIFLDYLRNGIGATAITPYSLRVGDQPTVAVPLLWSELKNLKTPKAFDIHSALERLAKQKKDPWPDYFSLKQKINILKTNDREEVTYV
jgi:bifunctional non-homologous end joining protein LigD